MSREIDERVVAMYFDNKDFEKNAQSTIKTLGQLKEGLNLEEGAKGLSLIQKATEKINFDRIGRSAKTFKNTVTNVGTAIKDAFNIGDGPARAMGNLFSTFQGYVTKFVGFDLASKLVTSIESAIRAITVAPVSAGWGQYNLNMDSVKTIMSGTGESIDVVNEKLAALTEYANKTVYSLADMTSNIGKFTNNGVKLNDAVTAMKGIANATADAGQGAQQASMAMYNISQAVGVGAMTTIDWKSLENANIATTKLKQTFIDVGVAQGTLVKKTEKVTKTITDADGKQRKVTENQVKYYVKGYEKGKKKVEVSVENFRETLQKKWLDKDTMMKTFQLYSGDDLDLDTIQSWGFTEEEAKRLLEIGKEASKAATEVRTFQKMWDAMTEAVQTGWATSFEYIIGNVEEATKFWTKMNDLISVGLDESSEQRNALLLEWRALEKQEDGTLKHIIGATDGREVLIQAIFDIVYAVKDLGAVWSSAWESVFGRMTGKKLLEITEQFRTFASTLRKWLGSTTDAESRLSKIRRGLQGFMNILKVVVNFVKIGFNLVQKLVAPVADILVNMFERVGSFFDGLGNLKPVELITELRKRISDLWKEIKTLFSVGPAGGDPPIVTKLRKSFGEFKAIIREWAYENGLGEVYEALSSAYHTITGWDGWTKIGDVLKAGWEEVNRLFQPQWEYDEFEMGTKKDAPIVQFFKDLGASITGAWNDLISLNVWTEIKNFFAGVWNSVSGLFEPTWEYDEFEMGAKKDAPIVAFFKGLGVSIREAWENLTAWEGWGQISSFFASVWSDINSLFEPVWEYNEFEMGTKKDPPIITFFQEIGKKMRDAWNGLISLPLWGDIGKFFQGVWDSINGVFEPVWEYDEFEMGTKKDAPIVAFFNSIRSEIEGAWNSITTWKGWEDIGNFFSNTWNWITGKGGASAASEPPSEQSVGLFQRIITSVTDFFNSIKGSIESVTGIPEVDAFFNALGTFVEGVFTIVTQLLESGGKIMKGQGSLTDWSMFIIPTLVGAATKIIGVINNKNLAKIEVDSTAHKFMEISMGILMISAAMAMISNLSDDQILKAGGTIAAIAVALGAIIHQIAKLPVKEQQKTTGVERFLGTVVKWAGLAGIISIVMNTLPGIIRAISEADVPDLGNNVLQTLTGVMTMIGGMMIALAVTQKLAPQGLDPRATLHTVVSILEVVAGILVGVLGAGGILALVSTLVGKENLEIATEKVQELGQFLGSLGSALGSLIGGLGGGIAGGYETAKSEKEQERLTDTLNWLNGMAGELDTQNLYRLTDLAGMITRISNAAGNIDNDKLNRLINVMAGKGTQIGLGQALRVYILALDEVAGVENTGKIANILAVTNSIAAFGKAVDAISQAMQTYWLVDGDLDGLEIMDMYMKAAEALAASIQKGIGDDSISFDASPIVDSIVIALGLGRDTIAQAVHNMVEEGLGYSSKVGTPYKTPTAVNDDGTFQFLSGLTNGETPTLDTSWLDQYLYGADGTGGILGDITSFQEKLPSMDEMFSGWMNFTDEDGNQLDLLGPIQEQLGTLQEQVDKMQAFKIKITPVFDMSGLNADVMQNFMGAANLRLPMPGLAVQMDNTATLSRLDTIQSQIDSMILRVSSENVRNMEAIRSLGSDIREVGYSISRLRLYLDTGALVGGIIGRVNQGLGDQMNLHGRTGVTTIGGSTLLPK